jgi:hypothetical protein
MLGCVKVIVSTSKENVEIQPDPRFGEGRIISEPKYKVRIKNGIKEWKKLNDDDE